MFRPRALQPQPASPGHREGIGICLKKNSQPHTLSPELCSLSPQTRSPGPQSHPGIWKERLGFEARHVVDVGAHAPRSDLDVAEPT